MKIKELLSICGKDDVNERGALIYYDCSGRSKNPKTITLHEEDIEFDSESENVTITFNLPPKGEDDKRNTTISVKDLSDYAVKNNALDYFITIKVIDGEFILSTSLSKYDVCFDDCRWVYLCY